MTGTSAIHWEKDADGVVTLTLDDPTSSANTMNQHYRDAMRATVDRLEAEKDDITGVVLTSAKKTFFAGGDLTILKSVTADRAQETFDEAEGIKRDLRRLETLGRPVVAAVNGTALGGGLEIALACHHRVVLDAPGVQLGLPEVTLGLLPGGGGVTRTVRMLGLADALMKVLLQGPRLKPAKAQEIGLVDELVTDRESLIATAKAWCLANPDAAQPWDRPGYRMPGGTPSSPKLAAFLPAFPANLRKQLKGAPYPAPRAIMSAAVEGALVDVDTASRIETRYLLELVLGQTAKNMIQAFFFDLQAINNGGSRPPGIERRTAQRVGVLGAGMMGAGIAYSCARSGMDVVLKDVSLEAAERGKAYSVKVLDKAVGRGRMTAQQRDEVLTRITPTAEPGDLKGVDVVIEAVFEDAELKHRVFGEIAQHVDADALLCSNTSTLPISGLAEGVDRPEDFVGLHFFSPVDKMPLVEIIRGKRSSDEALARAYDIVLQLKKTPIVVNDSRGFFTSRVIGTFTNEGLAMLAEGVHPVTIERATTQAGYPVGVLQLTDELNMELMARIRGEARKASETEGLTAGPHPADPVLDTMIELGRSGRLRGAGFYDYDDQGKRAALWPGLAEHFAPSQEQPPLQDLKDRLLVIEALESIRCLEEGVLTSVADANIGSIMGIGYPAWTGGVLQYVDGHPGGVAGFLARARELEARYGDRFAAPDLLVRTAERGGTFAAGAAGGQPR